MRRSMHAWVFVFCFTPRKVPLRGSLSMSVWMEAKRWTAPLSTLLVLPTAHSFTLYQMPGRCTQSSDALVCVTGGGQRAVWPLMRNGGLPSVALLPNRKHPYALPPCPLRSQPSRPPPTPHK